MHKVANTDEEKLGLLEEQHRLTGLCLQAPDLFFKRDSGKRKAILNALQCFKDDSNFRITSHDVRRYLRPEGQITLPARLISIGFDPKNFYTNTEDFLYVRDGFKNLILPIAGQISGCMPQKNIGKLIIIRSADDTEVRNELPYGHIFENASIFCADLADILWRQKDGGPGDLPNNTYPIIFYVRGANDEIIVVVVEMDTNSDEWNVEAHLFDDNSTRSRWSIRSCVLSASADF